jgi:replicative superfamily II helicase
MKLRPKVRFIAVSATIPNINDIGRWIGQGCSEGGKIYHVVNKVLILKFLQLHWNSERNSAPLSWKDIVMDILRMKKRTIFNLT